jgi:hypothetical protein
MSKKRISKKRKWPSELKGPFPMQELENQANEATWEAGDWEQLYPWYLRKLWEAETKRRERAQRSSFGVDHAAQWHADYG